MPWDRISKCASSSEQHDDISIQDLGFKSVTYIRPGDKSAGGGSPAYLWHLLKLEVLHSITNPCQVSYTDLKIEPRPLYQRYLHHFSTKMALSETTDISSTQKHAFDTQEPSADTRKKSFEPEFSVPPSNGSIEPSAGDVKPEASEEVQTEEEERWVTGFPLFSIIGAICVVCFLRLLDTSIIVTVKATALENEKKKRGMILTNHIFSSGNSTDHE